MHLSKHAERRTVPGQWLSHFNNRAASDTPSASAVSTAIKMQATGRDAITIIEIGKMNKDQAREYLESIRWPNGPICPHCQCRNVTRLQGEAHRSGTIQCNNGECRQQFTVTVGSVMESSHIPLVKWAMAWHLLCTSKRGMSARQLQRNLGLGSYRTAWLMAHRIRFAMEGTPLTLTQNNEQKT